jgi:superfamily II RNA helicase
MTNIKAKLEQLFEFEKELNMLLDTQHYESFQQQQALFGDQLKDFILAYSQQELNDEIAQLKRLEKSVQKLQERANIDTQKLKQQSLLMQRNKKKIKAYK